MKKLLLVTVFSLFFAFPHRVYALSVTPSVLERTIAPGVLDKTDLIVENDSDSIERIDLNVQQFKAGDLPGVPYFFTDSTHDYTSWVSAQPQKFVLGPHEKQRVTITISPPSNATPGGYYLAVFFTSHLPAQTNATVTSQKAVGVLYLLTVQGNLTHEAKISNFSLHHHLFSFFPTIFSFNLENVGNVHLDPHGQIRINALFSPHIRTLDLNPQHIRILPGSSREVMSAWDGRESIWWSALNPFRFGIYNAELFFDDMQMQGVLTTHFIILPPITILVVLGAVALLIRRALKKKSA